MGEATITQTTGLRTFPLGEDQHLYGTDDERPIARPQLEDISLIAWVNDADMFRSLIVRTMTSVYQIGEYNLQVIMVTPDAGCTNIGEAYNIGRQLASYRTKLYIHQDAQPVSRFFVERLHDMFDTNPNIGAVGLVGCISDTGGAYFHAPVNERRGMYWGTFYPERERVAIVDGMLLATRENIEWAECYEGPHMAIEDYCMRVREAGKEVWTIDAYTLHFSPGEQDDSYFRSVEKFQENWKHMLPENVPTAKEFADRGHLIKHYPVTINLMKVGDGVIEYGGEIALPSEE